MKRIIKAMFVTSTGIILVVLPLLFYFVSRIVLFDNWGYVFLAALSIATLSMESMTAFHIKIWELEVNGDNKDNETEYSETPTTSKPGFTLKTHGKDSEDFKNRLKAIRE